MALLNILQYPDPRLRLQAKPVTVFDDALAQTVQDMYETMYESSGIGLAATQVNIQQQILVMDLSENRPDPLCVINPEILETFDHAEHDEGCLSFPGVFAKVERAARIKIAAFDQRGEKFELEAEGLLAVCLQHEIDHLEGKVFIDYLSPLKRKRLEKKLLKQRRQVL
ncbi:Peptide deformylase [Piscirickettsia salmonis]|uniref:peptide deformylase n=1 Tax=Piscirickettsia salmonis TaxID=1238 RepID=UPI0012BB07A9|nr:peptide deformylase [Piscirickettsia salmonis]QGP56531.1 Peptide deformylase [Piscirickettsia salmonis]QGP61338.1 Peptide deformylase [Piscirickettsia salmonis]QGP66095.1 Peptide deformylase [Piscirickettsia salmonis]